MNAILEGRRERVRALRAEWGSDFRAASYARSTHALILVTHDETEECGPGLRWVTSCVDHDRLVGHETLTLARAWAASPETWCGVCAGTEAPDDEEDDEASLREQHGLDPIEEGE